MNSLGSSMLGGFTNSVYIGKALGVKEYAYCEEMNPSFRNTMEDGKKIAFEKSFQKWIGHFIIDDFLGDGKSILFGVFDGHGGRDVADFVISAFPKVKKSNKISTKWY